MRRVISLYLTGEFGKFVLAGGTAAAANFASRFAFDLVLPQDVRTGVRLRNDDLAGACPA